MRLGVAGWPVAHSRSPAIQNAALRAAGLTDWRYQLLPIPPALFAETVAGLPSAGVRGINVTIPHKQPALALVLERGGGVSERARAIGAVNTLVFGPAGELTADNTDAPALTGGLARIGIAVAGRRVLVLGAGGSARSAVWSLLHAGAAEVDVWSRRTERARALCAELRGGTPVSAAGPADLLVNCTPIGLRAEPGGDPAELAALPVPAAPLPYGAVADFVYRDGGTALARAARAQGIPTLDGLELLVGQGALSFEQFTGVAADVAAMRRAAGLPA